MEPEIVMLFSKKQPLVFVLSQINQILYSIKF